MGTGRQQQSCGACPGHHSVGHGWFSVRRLLHSLLRRTEEGLMVRELDAAWRHTQLSFREGTPTQHLRDSPLVSVPYGTPLADGRRLILSSSHSPTQPYSSLSLSCHYQACLCGNHQDRGYLSLNRLFRAQHAAVPQLLEQTVAARQQSVLRNETATRTRSDRASQRYADELCLLWQRLRKGVCQSMRRRTTGSQRPACFKLLNSPNF